MRVNKVAYDLSCFDNLEGGYLSFDISDLTTVVAAIHARYGVPQKNSQNIMWRDLEFGGCSAFWGFMLGLLSMGLIYSLAQLFEGCS